MNDSIIADPNDHLTQNRIGMTVREEIASRVLAGIFCSQNYLEYSNKELASVSVVLADALIKELERTKK